MFVCFENVSDLHSNGVSKNCLEKKKQYILLSKNIELESYKPGFKSQLFHLLVVWFAHVSLVPWGYFCISKIMIIPSPSRVTMKIKLDHVHRTHFQAYSFAP